MGRRTGLGFSPGMELLSRGIFPKSVSSLCAAALAHLGRAGLCYAVLASNGVSGHFADDNRSLLGLMQRN